MGGSLGSSDAHLTRPGWRWAVLGLPTGQGTLMALGGEEGGGLDWGRGREMGDGGGEEAEILNK